MRPRIAKTADRNPYPVDGKTILIYWHWLDKSTAIIYEDLNGNQIRGIAQTLSSDDVAVMTDLGNQHSGTVGEEVISLIDVNGNKTNQYERIHHIDPMENEPQRWFALGVDPNSPVTDAPKV